MTSTETCSARYENDLVRAESVIRLLLVCFECTHEVQWRRADLLCAIYFWSCNEYTHSRELKRIKNNEALLL